MEYCYNIKKLVIDLKNNAKVILISKKIKSLYPIIKLFPTL